MNSSNVADAFKKHGVVPDVIDKAPTNYATVVFKGGVEVELGNVLTPTQVKAPPKLSWESKDNKLYTVVMTDPDAPSRDNPKFREWHHWLVVNIPGNKVENGEVLSEYVGSGPPPDTGLHRYVFLIYEQSSGTISDSTHGHLTNRSADNRGGWRVKHFAQKHKLGEPVAGNFFQAEWDEYVNELYKQLGN